MELFERVVCDVGNLVEDGHQVGLLHQHDAFDFSEGRGVNLLELRPVRRGTEHPGIEHSREAEVARILCPARHLVARISAEERFSDDRELRRRLQVWFHRQAALDPFSPGQLPVGDFPRRIAGIDDHALLHDQLRHGNLQGLGSHLQQRAPGLRRGLAEHRAEEGRGHGSPGALIERAEFGVSHDDADIIQGDIEVLGEHLGQRGDRPLAHFNLPGEAGHMAVLADMEEGIEIAFRLGAKRARARRLRFLGAGGLAQNHPDHEPLPQTVEKFAPRRRAHACCRRRFKCACLTRHARGTHVGLAPLMAEAAARIASTMRRCAPQRQRLPFMPAMTSSGLGSGCLRRKSYAVRIMPGVQKPHCSASWAMNASWIGCSFPSWARPSIVTTSLPSTDLIGTEQDLTAR